MDKYETRDLVLSVTFTDYPKDFGELNAKTLLEGVRTGLKSPDGKVESEKEIELEGKSKGIEVTISAGDKLIRAQVYLVGRRLYQVLAVGKKDALARKEVEDLFKSFKVTE